MSGSARSAPEPTVRSERPESASSSALAAARDIWEWREEAGAPGGVSSLLYTVYLVLATACVLGVPLGRIAVRALARPDVLPYLLHPAAPGLLTALWLLACALLILAGAQRGPAILTPFLTATLASSFMPRRVPLLRPLVRSALAILAAGVLIGLVPGMTLEAADRADPAAVALLCAAMAGAALLGLGAWMLGELTGAGIRRLVAGLLGAAAGTAAVLAVEAGITVPGPGTALPGALAAGSSVPADAVLTTLALLIAGLLVALACAPLLNRLRGTVLLQQARTWEAAMSAATSGDLATAGGGFRALPSVGRALRAVRVPARPGLAALVLLYARRDLVALLRTPERALGGLAGAVAGGASLGVSTQLVGPVQWMMVGIGALLLWAGSGALVDGLRHGIATLGAPVLLGQDVGAQVLLHLSGPGVVLLASAAIGGVAFGTALPVLVAAVLLIGRVRDAAKGPMPLRLSMPMPTPQGDVSVLGVLAWQADAVILALVSAVVIALGGLRGGAAGLLVMLLVAAVMAVILALGARTRLRELRG